MSITYWNFNLHLCSTILFLKIPGAAVQLGRKLVLSLIANAFLCTVPREHPLGIKNRRTFNFDKFFVLFTTGE